MALAENRVKFQFLVLGVIDVTIVKDTVQSAEGNYFVSLDETGQMRVSFSYLPLSDFNPLPSGGFYIRRGKIERNFTA